MKKTDMNEEIRKPSRELLKKCNYDLDMFVKEMRKENEQINDRIAHARKTKHRKAA